MKETPKPVFGAIMNNIRDFEIARDKHWYRIPVRSAPKNARNFTLQYVAFYFTKPFGDHAFSVQWYGEVQGLRIVKRKEIFPRDVRDPKREDDYLRIELGESTNSKRQS